MLGEDPIDPKGRIDAKATTEADLQHAREWYGAGYTQAMKTPDDTLIFVTNRYKHAVADYFDKAYELEQKLEKAGKQEQLELVRNVLPKGVQAFSVSRACASASESQAWRRRWMARSGGTGPKFFTSVSRSGG